MLIAVDFDKFQVVYYCFRLVMVFFGFPIYEVPVHVMRGHLLFGFPIHPYLVRAFFHTSKTQSSHTMGDAVLSAFLQVLFQGIAHTMKEELKKSDCLKKERELLTSKVEMIQAVLKGAENMQLSELQKLWFGNLKDVSYDAMEVLDKYLYEDHRRQHLSSVRNNTVSSAMNPKRQYFRIIMAREIKDVAMRIDNLLKTAADFQVEVHGQTSLHTEGSSSSHPSSSFPPPDAHCRQEDHEHIVEMILRSDRNHKVQVLPILGEAYIGKTTVAQLVITDERISWHFELRPWVHVSNEFNIRRITADIIESIEGSSPRSNNLDNLQRHLGNLLRERRYLLVLDDYWQRDWHDWEQLTGPLLSGAPGSKIIVTTRIGAVAEDLRTSDRLGIYDPYELRGLSKEDCWSLFCKHAQCNPSIDAQLYGFGDSRSSRYFFS